MTILDEAPTYFSASYSEARTKLRALAQEVGLPVYEYTHPLNAPDGSPLATDVLRIGEPNARRLLVVVSGTHGVEGLPGSGGQIGWLRTTAKEDVASGTAVLLVHMLNPWGCAWRRRQTEDNVDLNRNFIDFDTTLPENDAYEQIHKRIVTRDQEKARTRASHDPQITKFLSGETGLNPSQALFAGQYRHGDGVGFGGSEATWSRRVLKRIIEDHCQQAQQLALIDIHTGLGPYGHGTLLCLDRGNRAHVARCEEWYGPGVVSTKASALPYDPTGDLATWFGRQFNVSTTSIVLEFGTFEVDRLLQLQIDDCRASRADGSTLDDGVRSEVEQFFYPATRDWMQSVSLRTSQVIKLALDGLQADGAASPLLFRAPTDATSLVMSGNEAAS